MQRVSEVPEHTEGNGDGRPEEPGDLLALERQVCFALSIAARSVLSVYRPVLEPLGLTHPQYLVMLALWGSSPVTVKELGEMLQLDAPTLSPLLKRLEAAGLVTRTRLPQDERHLSIELTARGRELRTQALGVPPTIIAKLGMQPSELEHVRQVLTTLNESARRAGVEPLPLPADDSV
jgi:MarR family transcriptional regulator, organic hydroperoxide resistance regulator